MKIAILSADFGLFFLLCIYLVHSGTTAIPCPLENCMHSDKCLEEVTDGVCQTRGDSCCSIVKMEYRTFCRHHGGECMRHCSKILQQRATDCGDDQVCCVLV